MNSWISSFKKPKYNNTMATYRKFNPETLEWDLVTIQDVIELKKQFGFIGILWHREDVMVHVKNNEDLINTPASDWEHDMITMAWEKVKAREEELNYDTDDSIFRQAIIETDEEYWGENIGPF